MAPFPIGLLDDEQAIADIFGQALKKHFPQASLISCTRLADALAYLEDPTRRCKLGLIIVDVDLHEEHTGLELVSVLRLPRWPTGAGGGAIESAEPLLDRSGLWSGCHNAYTNKPYTYRDWEFYADSLRTYWYEKVTTANQITGEYW